MIHRGRNRLVRKTMVDLLVHHIEFADIRPFVQVLILKSVFKVYFNAWLNLTTVKQQMVRKTMVNLGLFLNRDQNHLIRKPMVD